MSIFMPLAKASTALSSWLASHGTWLNSRWCGLTGGQEGQDLAAAARALGQRLDGVGHQRAPPLGAQRQPNVGGGQHSFWLNLPAPDRAAEPNAMPPICDIIDNSGPAMLLASSGSAAPTPSKSVRPPGRTTARSPACCRSSRWGPGWPGGTGRKRSPRPATSRQVHGVGDGRTGFPGPARRSRSHSMPVDGPGRS